MCDERRLCKVQAANKKCVPPIADSLIRSKLEAATAVNKAWATFAEESFKDDSWDSLTVFNDLMRRLRRKDLRGWRDVTRVLAWRALRDALVSHFHNNVR